MQRKITLADVTIKIIPTDDDQTPRQCYGVSGIVADYSEDADRFVENVQEMIDAHGLWGWCQVEVVATFGPLTGSAYLGGCSYRDEEDFRNGGYLPQMIDEAVDEIQGQIDEINALFA